MNTAGDARDPREHRCEAPGCTAWGAFGIGAHWWCARHRPAEGADDIRLADRPTAAGRQGRLL